MGQGRGGHFDQVRLIVMILLSFACSNVHSLSTPTASLQHFPSSRPRPPFSSTPTNTHKSAHPNRISRVHVLAREVTSELQPCKRRVRAHREFCCVVIKVTTLVMNPPRPKEELKQRKTKTAVHDWLANLDETLKLTMARSIHYCYRPESGRRGW